MRKQIGPRGFVAALAFGFLLSDAPKLLAFG